MGLLERALAVERELVIGKGADLDGRLDTDIDRMYYLVRSKGRISISAAAKQLGIARSQTAEFARILSEQDLIAIRRPLFGDAVLMRHEKDTDAKAETQEPRRQG